MFSTMTTESGRTVAVIDYSAVSTSGLGNLISGVAARLKDADIEEISFVETTLEELFSESFPKSRRMLAKFSTMAGAMVNDGFSMDTVVYAGAKGNIKVLKDASGEGYKSIKNKMVSL